MTVDNGTPTVNPSDIGSHSSPLSPVSVGRLYFNPKRFFENVDRLTKVPEVVIVAWIAGITYAMDRVDKNMLKLEFGSGNSGSQEIGQWLAESWVNYWGLVLTIGAINGAILWYLAGWWYRRRLIWSDAGEVSPEHARSVYVYQDLVQSAPMMIVALVQTSLYSNFMAAWNSEEYWSSIVLLFIFWSCVVSYKAAISSFSVTVWKARIWFLALPISLYIVALGLAGMLLAYLPLNSA
jgi:hypothetical protein